jgi:hypothetical protein
MSTPGNQPARRKRALGLIFVPENGGSTFHRSDGERLPDNTAVLFMVAKVTAPFRGCRSRPEASRCKRVQQKVTHLVVNGFQNFVTIVGSL